MNAASERIVWFGVLSHNARTRKYHDEEFCKARDSSLRVPTAERYAIRARMRLCTTCSRVRGAVTRALDAAEVARVHASAEAAS